MSNSTILLLPFAVETLPSILTFPGGPVGATVMTSALILKPDGYITILPVPTKLYVSPELAYMEKVSTGQFTSPETNQAAISALVMSSKADGPFVCCSTYVGETASRETEEQSTVLFPSTI